MKLNQKISMIAPWLICGLASFFYFYDYFVQAAPSVIANALMIDFQLDPYQLGLLGSAFYYTYALMQIPAAILTARFGSRACLTSAVFMSGIGLEAFALTHQFWIAVLARALIGCGSAFAFIGALNLIATWFHHKRFALVTGLLATAGCLGAITGEGPLLSLVNQIGWRQSFIYSGLFTILLAVFFMVLIRNKPRNQSGKKLHYNFRLYYLYHLFFKPQFNASILICFCCWFSVGVMGTLWGVPYLSASTGLSAHQAAWHGALFWISIAISSPIIGWSSEQLGSRKTPLLVCTTIGIISGLLLIEAPHLPIYVINLALIGLGTTAGLQALTFAVLKDNLTKQEFRVASGMNNMSSIVGAGVAQILFGAILQFYSHNNHHPIAIIAYQKALIIIPVTLVIGLCATLFMLKETHCQPLEPSH